MSTIYYQRNYMDLKKENAFAFKIAKEASSYGGLAYGRHIYNIVLPSFDIAPRESSHYQELDLWFKNQESADLFLKENDERWKIDKSDSPSGRNSPLADEYEFCDGSCYFSVNIMVHTKFPCLIGDLAWNGEKLISMVERPCPHLVELDLSRALWRDTIHNFVVHDVGVNLVIGKLEGSEIVPLSDSEKTLAQDMGLYLSASLQWEEPDINECENGFGLYYELNQQFVLATEFALTKHFTAIGKINEAGILCPLKKSDKQKAIHMGFDLPNEPFFMTMTQIQITNEYYGYISL